MFNIVLFEPEIPPNTGNIIRLCAVTGCSLHLIKPLGFQLDDKNLKRAGLDYTLNVPIKIYNNFQDYLSQIAQNHSDQYSQISKRIYLCSTKAQTKYNQIEFKEGDAFVFGPETRGLPQEILNAYPENQKIRIPMLPNSRSLNLANSVSIIVYEALRQQNFPQLV